MPATIAASTTTTGLIRFLLARIDEDDAELTRRTRAMSHDVPGLRPDRRWRPDLDSLERLKAESASRRQIIGTVQQLLVLRDQPCEKPVRDAAAQVLRALAVPYADRVGFRSEWRDGSRH